MWGPGALIYIINILPFANPILWNFMYRRGHLLGVDPHANTRHYYRKFWVRCFFGRFNYFFYTIVGIPYVIWHFQSKSRAKKELYAFTSYKHDTDEYDDEEDNRAHEALIQSLYNQKYSSTRELVLKQRAQQNHDLKIQAFNTYAEQYNIN